MTYIKEAQIAPSIQACVDILALARERLKTTLAEAQADCPHLMVYEKPYRSPNFNPQRLCMRCRLVETGSHWSGGSVWSYVDHSREPVLGNEEGRIIVPIESDAFYKLRIAA